jgi:hypothetical protein
LCVYTASDFVGPLDKYFKLTRCPDFKELANRLLEASDRELKILLEHWQPGEKKPAGPCLKLLSLVERKGLEAIA